LNRPEPPRDVSELVGDEVAGDELERLQRVHDLLLAAGPPAELPPHLAEPPAPEARLLRLVPRSRVRVALLLAAGLAAAAFAGGFLVGHSSASFDTEFTAPMVGTAAARASTAAIKIGHMDDSGNWPLLMQVRGLPELPAGRHYELYLSRKGKPVASCGTFRVHGGTTTVRLNAPYRLKRFDGWVVVERELGHEERGEILMRTPRETPSQA
jgi:hypothetical protein